MSATRVTIDESPASVPSRVAIGQVVGRYRVDAILGTGGMGTVARARDLDLDRDVALKVTVTAGDRHRADRLLREAQAMARLRVPNVRAVHDVGTAGGIDYVAMEYIAGADLSRWLATPRSIREIARVFAAAARGLAAAHAAGILHRDVKPSNILVGNDGAVVVTDFGLAQWIDEPARGGGTPGYIAPDREPDARSDQYSFCVALAEAAPASPVLRAIAARGSNAVAADRFASMDDVVAAIDRVLHPPRRWPLAIVAVAFGAIVLAVMWWPRAAADPEDDPDIVGIHALAERGFLVSARAAAERVVATGRPELRAVASYELGRVALYQNDTKQARSALDDASRLADASRDDLTRARADIALFMLAAARGSDVAAIDRAEAIAVASSSRVELDRSSRANLRYVQAIATIARGDQAAGRDGLAAALAIVTPPDLASLVTWAEIRRTQAHYATTDDRIAILRDLVATADRVGGTNHMEALGARGELAVALEAAGQLDASAQTMAEMRTAAGTPDGRRLIAEVGMAPAIPTHVMTVAVHEEGGRPVPGATVVAATMFRGNGRYLVGATPIYAERERATSVATTDAAGTASVRVPETGKIWIAAEHGERGRAVPVELDASLAHADLTVARWGRIVGTATGQVTIVSEAHPDGPPLVVSADRRGTLVVDRIAHGHYIAAACTASSICRAIRVVVDDTTPTIDLAIPAGDAELAVRVEDELHRPIESSSVAVLPADYAPANADVFQRDWMIALADRPGSLATWGDAHATRPAKLGPLPRGHYTVCADAIHGDTEDPAFAARLDARGVPIPLVCRAIELVAPSTDLSLVVPAASRVWLP